jgi:hypothetical protein
MHLPANISSAAPRTVREEVPARVRAIFEAPDLETARMLCCSDVTGAACRAG